jgi:hypothetical protein
LTAAILLLAAAVPAAVEAERDFAERAQRDGHWAAIRATAAPDAIMFAPGPVNALAYVAAHSNPGRHYVWRTMRVFISCDDSAAVTTGPWHRPEAGSHGSFTTVWERQGDGAYRWRLDDGGSLSEPLAVGQGLMVTAPASCRNLPRRGRTARRAAADNGTLVQQDWIGPGRALPSPPPAEGALIANGASADLSLLWEARAITQGAPGAHVLRVYQWNGRAYRLSLYGYWGREDR